MAGHGGARPGAGRKPTKTQDAAPVRRNLNAVEDASARIVQATEGGKFKTKDSFVNYGHRLGIGAQNILSTSTASFNPISRVRQVLEWMYAGQFVCKNAVDVPAEDMTREGVEITGDMDPEDCERIQTEAVRLKIWEAVCDTIKWSRLYGGCCAFMKIKGQNPSTPFKPESVGEGQFGGLYVYDRWTIDPSLELLVTDIDSPNLGLPMFYRVTADLPALPRIKMHHSRVLRMIGNKQPFLRAQQENLWGLSVYETILDRITAFDLGSTGAAQLIDKSFLRTYKIEGLKELIGSNDQAYMGLLQLLEVMRAQQSIEGVTLMDKSDELEKMEHGAFSGIAEILVEFRQQLSGALQIPQTKLFGTSPAGMNATGESDMRNYYDMIKARQIVDLFNFVLTVYKLIAQSLGIKWKDTYSIKFRPLWQPTEVEKSNIAKTITDAVLAAEEKGTISTQTAMKELKQQSSLTGVWTNISKKDIQSAQDVPVPAASIVMPGEGGPTAGGGKKPAPGGDKAPPRSAKQRDAMWTGQAGYSMEHRPNWLPEAPDELPAAVNPGAHPFDDASFQGMPIHIETRKGEVRESRDPHNPWKATMAADYGYVKGTASAEGPDEGMDVFVGPDRSAATIYVINQKNLKTGNFDEHKCMLGFDSRGHAASAYVSSYSDLQGIDRIMSMHPCTVDEFKRWLQSGNMRVPYGAKQ